MIDPLVRPAGSHDNAQIEALEAEARTGLGEQRGGARWLADHPAGAWADAANLVHVAHIESVVVGYIVTRVQGPLAVVETVYVTPEARELGFGDALLEVAIDAAREAGATTLDGEALPGDRHVKNLYERAGITARLITVSTAL